MSGFHCNGFFGPLRLHRSEISVGGGSKSKVAGRIDAVLKQERSGISLQSVHAIYPLKRIGESLPRPAGGFSFYPPAGVQQCAPAGVRTRISGLAGERLFHLDDRG